MSAASEKAAREWRVEGSGGVFRWWVYRGWEGWWVLPPLGPFGSCDRCFPTHAEAIAYADRMARRGYYTPPPPVQPKWSALVGDPRDGYRQVPLEEACDE